MSCFVMRCHVPVRRARLRPARPHRAAPPLPPLPASPPCRGFPMPPPCLLSRSREGRGRVPLSAWLGLAGRGDPVRCVMKCHVWSCNVMFRPAPSASAGPPFAARIGARPPACVSRRRAVRAPDARASRAPDAPLPPVPNTALRLLRFPESKRRPRKPPSIRSLYHAFPDVKPPARARQGDSKNRSFAW